MTLYKLSWDDFCAWYLEAVKPGFEQAIDRESYERTIGFFEDILRLLHPFTPFITEEIWAYLRNREANEHLIVNHMPQKMAVHTQLNSNFELIREMVAGVRTFRNERGMSPKETLVLSCTSRTVDNPLPFAAVLTKLANLQTIEYVQGKPDQSVPLVVRTDEVFLPIGENSDPEAEREKIAKELEYTRGFLKSVEAKLNNERFVSNAKPEVVEMERKKQQDAQARIQMLESQLKDIL
jgi:valyl-tRNA synthetase